MPESPPTQQARLVPVWRGHQDAWAVEEEDREEHHPAGDQKPTSTVDETNDSILDDFRSPHIAAVAAQEARAEQQQAQPPTRRENRDRASPDPR